MKLSDWIECDSRADLAARLSTSDSRIFEEFACEQCNTFGYLNFQHAAVCIPVVFYNFGPKPQSIQKGNFVLVGVSDQVAGFNFKTGRRIFVFDMPTAFHTFIAIDDEKVVVLDETGFVVLSLDGSELGSRIFGDIIDTWHFDAGMISGRVFSGDSFEFAVADLL